MSAALETLKATRKDVSRTVLVDGGEIVLFPAPATDVALMMFSDPAFAELFDNAGEALGDKEFYAEVVEKGVVGRALAGLVGICVRDRSAEFKSVLLGINADDFFLLTSTALEVSAPRGIADFFERVMRMAGTLAGTSTSPAAASIPSAS